MNEEIQIEEWAPWLAAIITLVGGCMRVLLLASKGMWLDETFSVWLAIQRAPEMLGWITKIDQHPPLYYLLLHFWTARFGDTPFYARLLSALFGTFTIPVIYLIGKRISGEIVGLAAAVLLALSPFNIYFAQETRMYTLLTFNAGMATFALVRLLTDPRSAKPIGSQFRDYLHIWRISGQVEPKPKGDLSDLVPRPKSGLRAWIYRHRWPPIQAVETDLAWVAYIIFSAATLLTHNTAVFFLAATNIFVLGLMLFQRFNISKSRPGLQPPSFGNWMKAHLAIFILWSPWFFVFAQQVQRVDREFWLPPPTWETIIQTLRYLLNNLVPNQYSQFMMWIMCAVFFLGLVYYRKKLSTFLFLAGLFAIPFLGELVVSIRQPIFFDKTLIWTTIPLFLILAAGIAQLRFRLVMVLALGILGTNYLFADSDYYRFVQKEDWGTAAGYVAKFAEKDDLVLFNSNFVEIPFNYYFRQYEDQYSIQVVKQGVPMDLFDSRILEPKMTENDISGLISMLHGHNRVWLVYSHNDYTDPKGLIPQTLESQMVLVRTRNFYGGKVQLYETP